MTWELLMVQIILPALLSGAVTWGVLKTELRYLRRDIDAAHRRLDKINAPAASLSSRD